MWLYTIRRTSSLTPSIFIAKCSSQNESSGPFFDTWTAMALRSTDRSIQSGAMWGVLRSRFFCIELRVSSICFNRFWRCSISDSFFLENSAIALSASTASSRSFSIASQESVSIESHRFLRLRSLKDCIPCAISDCRALCASICLLRSFWLSARVSVLLRIKSYTSTLGYRFCELVTFFQNPLPLTLGPLVESDGEPIHLRLEIIKSKIDWRKWSDWNWGGFCHSQIQKLVRSARGGHFDSDLFVYACERVHVLISTTQPTAMIDQDLIWSFRSQAQNEKTNPERMFRPYIWAFTHSIYNLLALPYSQCLLYPTSASPDSNASRAFSRSFLPPSVTETPICPIRKYLATRINGNSTLKLTSDFLV